MKKSEQQNIPIHRMDTLFPQGIEFRYMDINDDFVEGMIKSDKHVMHRDDYYMFLFWESASAVFSVDFEDVQLHAQSVFYIRPGQVHFASLIREAKGWSLAIDAMLVDKTYKDLFEEQLSTQKSICLDADNSTKIRQTAYLLQTTLQTKPTALSYGIALNMANVFIGIIAEQYLKNTDSLLHKKSRSAQITHQFRKLLSENFKVIKSPSKYAELLNYSLSHLNESVKNNTGFSVSHCILQQVILEAKRLLYYTDLDIKEIAFALGYEDHTYFSRIFSKSEGVSPGIFRQKIRE